MSYETLLQSVEGQVATITLNRPKVLNAMNKVMFHEMDEAFAALAGDAAVRVVLLRGAGGKAFAAGTDITELAEADASTGELIAERAQRVFRRIETLGKPVIACIDGYALGGGCELAMACTLRLASETARLGQPEIKLGLIPGYGGTQRLPRLVGQGAALKMLLTGAMVDAAEALRATLIAGMPPLAVAAAIEAVGRGADLPLDEAIALEATIFGRLCGTEDKREGTQAFLQKRAAVWVGR